MAGRPAMRDLAAACGATENLSLLRRYLQQYVAAADTQVADGLQYVLLNEGKRLRPLLLFLSARLVDPHIAASALLPLQAALEMVHNASLVHDDIIDRAGLRRGQPALHARLGEAAAVRLGDYLLACALSCLAPYQQPRYLPLLAACLQEMCLGEFQQAEGAFVLERQSLADYTSRIRRKTASLFALCCQFGALAAGADEHQERALRRYGENLGMAFQINDDIGDFTAYTPADKAPGQDVRQGIFTLPLLYALQMSAQAQALAETALLRHKEAAHMEFLMRVVRECGALERAGRLAVAYGEKAQQALQPFADGATRQYLCELALNLC